MICCKNATSQPRLPAGNAGTEPDAAASTRPTGNGWFNGGKTTRRASRGNRLGNLTLGPVSRVRGCCPLGETTQGTSHKGIRLRWQMTFRTPTPEATCFHRPLPFLSTRLTRPLTWNVNRWWRITLRSTSEPSTAA